MKSLSAVALAAVLFFGSGAYFFSDYILYYTGKALDEGKLSVISFK